MKHVGPRWLTWMMCGTCWMCVWGCSGELRQDTDTGTPVQTDAGGESDGGDASSDSGTGMDDATDTVDIADTDSADAADSDGRDAVDATADCGAHANWLVSDDQSPTLVARHSPNASVTLDGKLDEEFYRRVPSIEVADQSGKSDNKMSPRAYWTDSKLYVATRVRDNAVESTSEDYPISQDSVEFFFDTAYDRAESMQWDDVQIAVSVDEDFLVQRNGATEAEWLLNYAASETADGYTIELEIPWEKFDLSPKKGLRVGFHMANNDLDSGERTAWSWKGIRPFKQPDKWSRLRLGGADCSSNVEIVDPGWGDGGMSKQKVGGGAGYTEIVDRNAADFIVGNLSELTDALDQATSGQIVYVDDGAKIDLGGKRGLEVGAEVTLASGRGRNDSKGGLIYSDKFEAYSTPAFWLRKGARFTGLRLRGPQVGFFVPPECRPRSECSAHDGNCAHHTIDSYASVGIRTKSADVEIDNNEVYGWTFGGVRTSSDPHVHHNRIYGSGLIGLGYGVVSYGGQPLIEYNWFNENRHSVAMGGGDGGYTARFNIQGPVAIGHVFDVHPPGGTTTLIHHNTVEAVKTVCDSEVLSAYIRDEPSNVCKIHHNWFYVDSKDTVKLETQSNVNVYKNHYGTNEPASDIGAPR